MRATCTPRSPRFHVPVKTGHPAAGAAVFFSVRDFELLSSAVVAEPPGECELVCVCEREYVVSMAEG